DRKASYEGREPTFKTKLNSKCLVAGQGRAVGWSGKKMRGPFMPRGSKGLVPGDLCAGNACPVHALEHDRIAAFVHDTYTFEHANLFGFGDCCINHQAGFFKFKAYNFFHGCPFTLLNTA